MIYLGLAALANWIAFGAGERVCTGGISFAGIGWFSESSDLACRIPFGYGALIVDALLVYATAVTLQQVTGDHLVWRMLRKGGEWGLWITLAPLLLLALLLLAGYSLAEVLKARWTTGQWPRNEAFIRRQQAKGLLRRGRAGQRER